jgi:hypothetical protein
MHAYHERDCQLRGRFVLAPDLSTAALQIIDHLAVEPGIRTGEDGTRGR